MVDILMAVYNGERFMAEQIESILAQTYTDWQLIICDDGSSDNSVCIAENYAGRFPGKIKLYRNEKPTGSAQANFMGMLRYSVSEYIMFCDHDDVWLPDKIKLTMDKMQDTEAGDRSVPVLVHGELEVVDAELNTTAPFFTKYQGLDPRCDTLNRLLVQNNVTGCTVMINRSLYELVKEAPAEKMLMHDWWFALAASAFGRIGFVEIPLIKYRQHGSNQLGAVNNRSIKGIINVVSQRVKTKKRVSITYAHAADFYAFYMDRLSEESRKCIERYLSIPDKNKLSRMAALIKYNYLKQNFITAVGQLIFC